VVTSRACAGAFLSLEQPLKKKSVCVCVYHLYNYLHTFTQQSLLQLAHFSGGDGGEMNGWRHAIQGF